MSGKKNPAESRKKRNSKRISTMKDPPTLSGASPAATVPGKMDNPIQHAAIAQSVFEPVDEVPIENMLPAICQIPPAHAMPWETDACAEHARPAENEIHIDCSVPAENVSSAGVYAPCKPELRVESTTLVPFHTHNAEEPPLKAARRGFRAALADVWTVLAPLMTQIRSWTQQKLRPQQGKRRLRVCESVSLGEKRFVAVIQVDSEQFLVGGSSSSVATLAHLERPRQFSDVFQRQCEQDLSRA
jgi:hypothetical protein